MTKFYTDKQGRVRPITRSKVGEHDADDKAHFEDIIKEYKMSVEKDEKGREIITLHLKIPPNFYEYLSMTGFASQMQNELIRHDELPASSRLPDVPTRDEMFALYWMPAGDELQIVRKGVEYTTSWQIWLELERMNPGINFYMFGSSDEEPKKYLLHIGGGTFQVVDPEVAYERLRFREHKGLGWFKE